MLNRLSSLLEPLRGMGGRVSFGRCASFWMIVLATETVLYAQLLLLYAIRSDHWAEAGAFLELVKVPATALFSVQFLVALVPYLTTKLADRKSS